MVKKKQYVRVNKGKTETVNHQFSLESGYSAEKLAYA